MFADSNVSESITRRTIKQYDEFPFKVNSNHLTLSKDKGVGLNWSRGESINIWNSEFSLNHQADHQIESNNTWRTFSSNYLSIQNHQLKHTLSGRNLLIFDVVEKENSNLLIAGVFEQTLSVGNREVRSSEARSGFVLEMNNYAKVVWVKTFGGDVEFDNFQICLAGNDEMTLAGSFVGTMHVQEKSTSLTSGESLSNIFLLSFDMDGKITDAISTDKGNLSLVRIHESNGLIFITANDLETSNSAVKSVVVVFNDNFSTSDIFDLESSSDLQINDSCLEQGTLFIAGYYNGLFSYNQSPLTESSAKQGFILGINLEDSKMPLQNAKFFESTIGSSVEAIASDYWGDLFFGLSFEGQIKLIDEHLSEGGRDLLLAKMVGIIHFYTESKSAG